MNELATIMYRNPLEQWLWESGIAWWLYGALAAFFLCIIIFFIVDEWKKQNRK